MEMRFLLFLLLLLPSTRSLRIWNFCGFTVEVDGRTVINGGHINVDADLKQILIGKEGTSLTAQLTEREVSKLKASGSDTWKLKPYTQHVKVSAGTAFVFVSWKEDELLP